MPVPAHVTRRRAALLFGLPFALAAAARAAEPQTVRIGVMQSGTVQWEMDVIHRHGFDNAEGVSVVPTALVGKDASAVAFQARAVDVILTDFLWVSRQRQDGADVTFVPHSSATGGLMLRPDSTIPAPSGLVGQRIGVAGNAVDKSWLIFRAYGKRILGVDPAQAMHPVFGAPPLLNELIRRGEIPAVLNFWNYTAPLKAEGYTELLTVAQMMGALGMSPQTPLLGWVFSEKWAAAHKGAIEGFIRADLAAARLMEDDDGEWTRLQPLLGVSDPATRTALRDAWRAGQVRHSTPADAAAAADLFRLLADIGGPDVVGDATTLAPGTFWDGVHF
jgi:NitT/TauT family transport system substrate-binding protein